MLGEVIRSFADRRTERIWGEEYVRRVDRQLQRTALRKGQHSIRVNDQWRICFTWNDGGADSVELVDYH